MEQQEDVAKAVILGSILYSCFFQCYLGCNIVSLRFLRTIICKDNMPSTFVDHFLPKLNKSYSCVSYYSSNNVPKCRMISKWRTRCSSQSETLLLQCRLILAFIQGFAGPYSGRQSKIPISSYTRNKLDLKITI